MTREEVTRYMENQYGAQAEYPFEADSETAVFRHKGNGKWFSIIMRVSARKIGLETDDMIDIMNVKADPFVIGPFLTEPGFYRAYHMNKDKWISVRLDGSVDFEKLCWLLDLSFELTAPKPKRDKVKK